MNKIPNLCLSIISLTIICFSDDTLTVKTERIVQRSIISECDSIPDYTLSARIIIENVGFSHTFKSLYCKKLKLDTIAQITYPIIGCDTIDSTVQLCGRGVGGKKDVLHSQATWVINGG